MCASIATRDQVDPTHRRVATLAKKLKTRLVVPKLNASGPAIAIALAIHCQQAVRLVVMLVVSFRLGVMLALVLPDGQDVLGHVAKLAGALDVMQAGGLVVALSFARVCHQMDMHTGLMRDALEVVDKLLLAVVIFGVNTALHQRIDEHMGNAVLFDRIPNYAGDDAGSKAALVIEQPQAIVAGPVKELPRVLV